MYYGGEPNLFFVEVHDDLTKQPRISDIYSPANVIMVSKYSGQTNESGVFQAKLDP